jgi:hypothetical protein
MMMKYKDFKMLSKDDMKQIRGGNPPALNCIPGGSVVGTNFYNGVCTIDLRICKSDCSYCSDFCGIASAPEATTAAQCSALSNS